MYVCIYIATDNSHPLAWYFCEASNEQQTRRNATKDATKHYNRRRTTTRRRVTRRGCSHGTPQPIAGVAPALAASLELNGGKCEKFLLQRCESLLMYYFSNIFPCPFHFPLIFLEIPGSKNKKRSSEQTGKNMFRSCDPLSQNSKESAFTAPMNGWQSGGPEKNGLFSFVLWARFNSTKSKENT